MDELISVLEQAIESIRREAPPARECVEFVYRLADGSIENPQQAAADLVAKIARQHQVEK